VQNTQSVLQLLHPILLVPVPVWIPSLSYKSAVHSCVYVHSHVRVTNFRVVLTCCEKCVPNVSRVTSFVYVVTHVECVLFRGMIWLYDIVNCCTSVGHSSEINFCNSIM